ncbi:PqqD family protein [Alteraurantiacibacter palmitatis]|uniref:PqqD family protein n=1 Tax=Alteraurantiacibacter palmitatis TaxID=2054628 RepID=A0ABV7E5K1_9SPHN
MNATPVSADAILSASEDAVAREVGGELVLMHLASGTYFGLNPVGARIWQLIEDEPRTLASLCEVIAEEFDAPIDVIEQDLAALAGDLAAHSLVEVQAA